MNEAAHFEKIPIDDYVKLISELEGVLSAREARRWAQTYCPMAAKVKITCDSAYDDQGGTYSFPSAVEPLDEDGKVIPVFQDDALAYHVIMNNSVLRAWWEDAFEDPSESEGAAQMLHDYNVELLYDYRLPAYDDEISVGNDLPQPDIYRPVVTQAENERTDS